MRHRHKNTDTNTQTQTHRHKHTDTNTQTLRHADLQTNTQMQTQTHAHKHGHRHTDKQITIYFYPSQKGGKKPCYNPEVVVIVFQGSHEEVMDSDDEYVADIMDEDS